jgi:hypothetical protein
MKRFIYVFMAILLGGIVQAQMLTPIAISNGGGFISGNKVKVSYTIGEPVTGLITNNSSKLSQGFQQSYKSGTSSVIEAQTSNYKFMVFPNPTKDIINVTWEMENQEPLTFELSDLSGRILIQQTSNEIGSMQINISLFSPGFYYLKIKSEPNNQSVINKILKTN